MATHLLHLDPHHQLFQFFTSSNLLFLASFRVLHSRSRFGALMIQVDIGGHRPNPFEPPPSILSIFKLQHNLLFLAVFRVLNFQSHFEALKYDEYDSILEWISRVSSCSPRIDLSNDVLCVSNRDSMPKLRPREVETQIYSNGAHSFGTSSPRVRFLDVLGFTLFLSNK